MSETVELDYTREQLIEICERAVVPEAKWYDRDSAQSQVGVGTAWALLRAGCDFQVVNDPPTNARTIWIRVQSRGFQAFETGDEYRDDDLFYLPTPARLDAAAGGDWY